MFLRLLVMALLLAAGLAAGASAVKPYPGLLMGLGLVGLAWGGGAACPAPPRKQIVVTLRVAEAQPGVRQLRLVEVR